MSEGRVWMWAICPGPPVRDGIVTRGTFFPFPPQSFGRNIISRYRRDAKAESLAIGNDVTFPEFVTYLTDPQIRVNRVNEHWDQYYQLCHPCHIHYDFIGKLYSIYRTGGG